MPVFSLGRVLPDEGQRAANFEPRSFYLVETVESLLTRCKLELSLCNCFLPQVFLEDLSIADQTIGRAGHQRFELRVRIKKVDNYSIDREQGRSADEATRESIIGTDDRILNGVR